MSHATRPLHLHHPAALPLERIGFELGWDYAHYRVEPPAPYAQEPSALQQGLFAGRAAFGLRTLQPTRPARKWLQLRLHAWLRGRSVELFQVTPNFLRQLEVSHCPVTRVALSAATQEGSDASVDRVRNDAGYAAGNLAVMSTQANHAKGAHGFTSAHRLAVEAAGLGEPSASAQGRCGIGGLTAPQWARVATLCSFVEPLSHDEATALPMHVLPPNRLRLFNPVQALQALVSRQLLRPGWSLRCARIEELLKGKTAKRDFEAFVMALVPRVLEAGALTDAVAMQWAVEDAWSNPLVQKRWESFARPLGADACSAIVVRAGARRLATTRVEQLSPTLATEGWNLETRGYVAQLDTATPSLAVAARRVPVAAPLHA